MNIVTQKYKPYPLVRGFMTANNFGVEDMARKIEVSRSYYLQRINGHAEWSLKDIHKLMDLMQEPADKIGEYFPEGGYYG